MKKYGIGIICAFLVFLISAGDVKAKEAEQLVEGTMWETVRDIEVKEKADSSSKTVAKVSKGELVLLLEDESEGWCKIQNKTVSGYIQSSDLQIYHEEAMEEINQEFEILRQQNVRVLQEYDLAEKERRVATIWGTIIAIFALITFVLGFFMLSRKKHGENANRETREQREWR